MDKAERIANQIREEIDPHLLYAEQEAWAQIAAILRREYGDARREAMEEAARICDQHALNWENGRITSASMDRVAQARMDAAGIRAAKEER